MIKSTYAIKKINFCDSVGRISPCCYGDHDPFNELACREVLPTGNSSDYEKIKDPQ